MTKKSCEAIHVIHGMDNNCLSITTLLRQRCR